MSSESNELGNREVYTDNYTDEERVANYRKSVKEGGYKFYEGYIKWFCNMAGTDDLDEALAKVGEACPGIWSNIRLCREWNKYDYGCMVSCPSMWRPTAEIKALFPSRKIENGGKVDPMLSDSPFSCLFCHVLSASSLCRGFDAKTFLDGYKNGYMSEEYKRQYNEALPKVHKIIDGYREGLDEKKDEA